MEKLKFKAARQEQAIEIEQLDGSVKSYMLREFSGTERAKHQKRFKMNFDFKDGEPTASMSDYEPMPESEFLSLCLFDENNAPVSEEDILKFSSTTLIGLYKAGLEINGLDKEANKKAKNDSGVKSDNGTS